MAHTLSGSPSPGDLLGSDHPFTRANELFAVFRRQLVAVGVALLAGVLGLILGVGHALALVIGAAIVALVLAVLACEQWDRRRFAARQLVLDGRETLPLAPIQR